MPVMMTKMDGYYRNRTPGGVKGKHMTLKNARAQKRLLMALEHDPTFKFRLHKRKK